MDKADQPIKAEADAEAVIEKDLDAESENSYDPLFDDEGDGQDANVEDANVEVDADGVDNNLNTMTAPSAGLSLPGLTLPTAAASPKPQAKTAVNAPAAAKLPEVDRVSLPSFGDASLPQLGGDVFLSAALDGECLIWDRRAATKEVRQLDIPKASRPWSISVSVILDLPLIMN